VSAARTRGALAIGAAVLALTVARAAQKPAIFSAGVEAVRVDALVMDGARVVGGLGPGDFSVRDNGVPQDVDIASFEEVPLTVVLVLDASESVVGPRLEHLRAAGVAALDGLTRRDQAALLTFNQSVSVASPRTADIEAVRSAIQRIRPGGGTALYDAIHSGIVLGSGGEGRTLVLVFTDGTDTSSFLTKESVRDTARRSDAVVYGAVEGTRTPFLKDLAAETGGTVFTTSSTRDLPGLFVRIREEFRQRYLIGYSPRGVAREGWHRVDVSVKGRSYTVKAKSGYQVGR
jgi:Mg-chelatase subunit ChlD